MPKVFASLLFEEGHRLMAEGNWPGAMAAFRQALSLDPTMAEANVNLGLLMAQDGCATEAEAQYRAALAHRPELFEAHLFLGNLCLQQKRFAEAELAYRQALQIAPGAAVGWSSLGVLLASVQQDDDAERCYRHALVLDPDYLKAKFNLAYLLLRQGRFGEGWACFEAREWHERMSAHFGCPRWQGQALAGARIVVVPEAGHGDMIQFCRYVPRLRAAGAGRVDLACQPALVGLFTTLDGVDGVFAADQALGEQRWDFWVPPMSFPFLFGTKLESIPADVPYLSADPGRIAYFRARMADEAAGSLALRVGLVWQGNPRFENDADRSLASLSQLAPLQSLAGCGAVRFFSLQVGAGAAEAREAPPFPMVDLSGELDDFADTAAALVSLDLLISVDTATAHLAGALGRPCWLLLPNFKTDWRWLTGRADTPWYPATMRLFRQGSDGQWGPVIEAVRDALEATVTGSAEGQRSDEAD